MSQLKQSGIDDGESPTGRHIPRKSARVPTPMRTRALLFAHWRVCVAILGALVGLVAQLLLLTLAWELWELSVSLMEVWAELARKHLELTL